MKKTFVVASVLLAALLAGCATAGNEHLKGVSQQSVSQTIAEGKTTKADVAAAFGSANKVSFTDSGLEIWSYEYAHATPKVINFVPVANLFAHGADVAKKTLTVLFDDKGIVKKYTFAETNDVVKGGIAQ